MNIALIFAGGTGERMNSKAKPKQFLNLHGKPILIYTIEKFELHSEIDYICVVCLKEWKNELLWQINKFNIKKVKWVVDGGETGHESIYLGLQAIGKECGENDIILIHDGVRPLITEQLISENIKSVKRCGNAITVEKAVESIVEVEEENDDVKVVPKRNLMRIAKAPQSFYYKDIMGVHKRAEKDKFKAIDSSNLMNHYGYKLHTVESSPYNIKITTPSDFYVFRALYEAIENSQIFGL